MNINLKAKFLLLACATLAFAGGVSTVRGNSFSVVESKIESPPVSIQHVAQELVIESIFTLVTLANEISLSNVVNEPSNAYSGDRLYVETVPSRRTPDGSVSSAGIRWHRKIHNLTTNKSTAAGMLSILIKRGYSELGYSMAN